ncbi:subtilisin-like protease [Dorcoceras hygrometricum]|uniref:Subtilisin-like protease n=1 Tax=Dorcoceras hygrometricum TaxID=472368 RepID=A0A2Z7C4K1_9LAMI|nr:subtilisin-like protease [Dorcoceras hygrometricum]
MQDCKSRDLELSRKNIPFLHKYLNGTHEMCITAAHAMYLLLWILLCRQLPSVLAERSSYIVHMDKSYMPTVFSSNHFWYSSMLESTKTLTQTSSDNRKLGPKLIYTYENAVHGFSAVLSQEELEAIKKSPGFLLAYHDGSVTMDTTHTYKFLSLNTAAGLWPASEYGKDVIVGVVDTGIWPESPSFKDDGMTEVPARWKGICQQGDEFNSSLCNKKIIGARYFNQGARAANPDVEISVNSARDTDGHGTHVASIAAGNYVDGAAFFGYALGTARGIAPHARLAIYKVLWRGASQQSDVLAGIDQAVADGVDILSISLSDGGVELYENFLSIASFGAREKGVLVSVSAGNRGYESASLLQGYPWATVVASGTVDRWFSGTLTLGNGEKIVGWSTFPARPVIKNLPLVYNRTLSACDSSELLAEAPGNSIIICNFTGQVYGFLFLMDYLSRTNVKPVIIIADEINLIRSSSFPHPGVIITPKESLDVIRYASRSAKPIASIDFQQTILGTKPRPSPALSDDSSRGPARNYQYILKPDIMAPGVLILAAYNPNIQSATINTSRLTSDYTLLSGTSMACPHISGTAALLKAAHPEWSPSAIQSAMMTTANPLDNTNQPIKDMASNYENAAGPLGIGAGHVDPNRALDPGLIYDATPQDFVNLVCSMNFTPEQTKAIIRSSYNCSNPSSDLNYPSFIAIYSEEERGKRVTRRFTRTVTNVGSGATTYKAKVETPNEIRIRVSPRILKFRKKNETQSYSLTISFRAVSASNLRYGSITWVEENGNHTVRSPIDVCPGLDLLGY